jgi:cyclopropane-fatty-acyl-phospholipid synthase
MKSSSIADPRNLVGTRRPAFLDWVARDLVIRQLQNLDTDRLILEYAGQTFAFGQPAHAAELQAHVEISDASAFRDIAFGGTVGAGEAYMRGAWRSDDLVCLVRLLLRNREVLDGMDAGTARLTRPLMKLFHWLNPNTRTGAKRNIAAHYDLGNEFFAEWLDESMMYSSAIFAHESMSLADAQRHRLRVVCDKLELTDRDHLIEIGTGWGGLALFAARERGCRVTTTTISRQQYELARQRIAEAGLETRVQVLLRDYRDLTGEFDKLVSIEMIEAIGNRQYEHYFAKCNELLRPGGRMLIQAITIDESQYDIALREVDFIQRYIFPGGCLPSISVMADTIARMTNLVITSVDDIGRHYATTLRHWRMNFFERLDRIRNMGYPDEFIRMWEFYLTYCEGGFRERAISDVHLVAEKPAWRT